MKINEQINNRTGNWFLYFLPLAYQSVFIFLSITLHWFS